MLKPATAKELPVEQQIFTEAWNIIKEYHNINVWDYEEEWEQVLDRSNELYKLGKGNKALETLSHGMALLVGDYLHHIGISQDKEACLAAREERLKKEEALKNHLNNI